MKGFVNLTHTNNKKIQDLKNDVENKLDSAPLNNIPLINDETGKLDNAYLPDILSGYSRKFAGSFGEDGIIVASAYASEINGQNINDISLEDCVGYELVYTGENPFNLGDLEVNKNDLVLCNGANTPNWILYDNSDKVVSVNGQTGAVTIDIPEVGLKTLTGTAERPIFLGADLENGGTYLLKGYFLFNMSRSLIFPYPVIARKMGDMVVVIDGVYISSSGGISPVYENPLISSTLLLQVDSTYPMGIVQGVFVSSAGVTSFNGSQPTGLSISFYAPTSAGVKGRFLVSNGTGAPTWQALTLPTVTRLI